MIKRLPVSNLSLPIVIVIASFCTVGVQAAPASFTNNGTTTIHHPENLEWLDLTETTNLSYDSVAAELVSGAGLGAQGWRFATDQELQTMLSDFFSIGYSGGEFSESPLGAEDNPIVNEFVAIFGDTFLAYLGTVGGVNSFGIAANSTTSGYSNGFYLSSVGTDNTAHARFVFDYEVTTGGGAMLDLDDAINGHAIDASTNYADLGSWLVRPAPVPLPSSLVLISIAMASLAFCRKTHSNA